MPNRKVSPGRPPVLKGAYRTALYLTTEQVAALDTIGRFRNSTRSAMLREVVDSYIASFFARNGQENHAELGEPIAKGVA